MSRDAVRPKSCRGMELVSQLPPNRTRSPQREQGRAAFTANPSNIQIQAPGNSPGAFLL